MKIGDLVTYRHTFGGGRPPNINPRHVALVLRVYNHLQEYKDVEPFNRELADVMWTDGMIVTHDTYEIEVINKNA